MCSERPRVLSRWSGGRLQRECSVSSGGIVAGHGSKVRGEPLLPDDDGDLYLCNRTGYIVKV